MASVDIYALLKARGNRFDDYSRNFISSTLTFDLTSKLKGIDFDNFLCEKVYSIIINAFSNFKVNFEKFLDEDALIKKVNIDKSAEVILLKRVAHYLEFVSGLMAYMDSRKY